MRCPAIWDGIPCMSRMRIWKTRRKLTGVRRYHVCDECGTTGRTIELFDREPNQPKFQVHRDRKRKRKMLDISLLFEGL